MLGKRMEPDKTKDYYLTSNEVRPQTLEEVWKSFWTENIENKERVKVEGGSDGRFQNDTGGI